MNKILLVLILTFSFQALVKAEGVRDFEIERMSVGDSLLEYMDENLIKKAKKQTIAYYYKNDFVTISTWDIKEKFKIYDDVGIILKTNDKKYEIFGIEGTLYFKDKDIEKCYKKQNEISEAIKNSLNLSVKADTFFVDKSKLSSHQLSVRYIDFELDDGVIRTTCYEIQAGVRKNSDVHLLYVVVNSPTFWKYLATY
jgi:hypothetical protein